VSRLNSHPDPDDLMLYADGELSWRDRMGIRRHVAGCWKCRTELDDLRIAMGDFTRYCDQVLLPAIPPPPRAWKDLQLPKPPRRPLLGTLPRTLFSMVRGQAAALAVILCGFSLVGLAVVLIQRANPPASPPPAGPKRTLAPRNTVQSAPVASQAVPTQLRRAPAAPSGPDRNTEVRIFAALHRIGSDVGEPVEVGSAGPDWLVTATGLASDRESELRAGIGGLPHVRLVVERPEPTMTVQAAPLPAPTPEPERSGLPRALAEHFATPSAAGAFVGDAISESETLLARAHALRVLEERFPPAVQSGLGEEERAMLARIRSDHAAALKSGAAGLRRSLVPVLALAGPVTGRVASGANCPLLECVQNFDRLLTAFFSAPPDGGVRPPPAEVVEALNRVESALEALP
jgi:anti-sigma factor RsiW